MRHTLAMTVTACAMLALTAEPAAADRYDWTHASSDNLWCMGPPATARVLPRAAFDATTCDTVNA
jgi:hypothetical protein